MIEVHCACGKVSSIADEHAGKKGRCKACGAVNIVPDLPAPLHGVESGRASGGGAAEDRLSLVDSKVGMEEDLLGVEREATLTDIWKILNAISVGLAPPRPAAASAPIGPREYKVVTQKDKWFSGKFDPEKVEGALNAYAKQGWTLKGVAAASVPGFGGQRDEIVIIMER